MRKRIASGLAVVLLIAILAAIGAATGRAGEEQNNLYLVHNLVSDQPGIADFTDPNLVNAWGLTRLAGSPWWVANNETSTSTLYRGNGTPVTIPGSSPPQQLVVQVHDAPTGVVGNGGSGFVLGAGPARFIFVTENSQVEAWNGGAAATVVKTVPNAIFKGVTIAGNRLYATDFHQNQVDVFDSNFNRITVPGGFADPLIPDGFAPFGIQNVEGRIFVTYAKQDEDAEDELHGVGLGFVDMFDTDGNLLGHVGIRGRLNAPWGITRAPSSGFGKFSGDLLVGNFGDGRIFGFRPFGSCAFETGPKPNPHGSSRPCFISDGPLYGSTGHPISIDGLWGIGFGAGNTASGPVDTLYFAAGPDDESHGLFGTVVAG